MMIGISRKKVASILFERINRDKKSLNSRRQKVIVEVENTISF